MKLLASGNEAVALAAKDCGVSLGCGYPGTPSSEILDEFSKAGGNAEWAPNEKCALEVAIGAAYTGCRALATMKHVGLNVAADPFFTIATAVLRAVWWSLLPTIRGWHPARMSRITAVTRSPQGCRCLSRRIRRSAMICSVRRLNCRTNSVPPCCSA